MAAWRIHRFACARVVAAGRRELAPTTRSNTVGKQLAGIAESGNRLGGTANRRTQSGRSPPAFRIRPRIDLQPTTTTDRPQLAKPIARPCAWVSPTLGGIASKHPASSAPGESFTGGGGAITAECEEKKAN